MKSNHCRTCQIQDHNNQPIRFICLEERCIRDRLICHFCIRDRHRKHWIANIDQYIEPLARLSMNSHESANQTYVLALQNAMTSISESWQNISELVGKQAKNIEDTIINQLDTVSRTFSDDLVKKACNDLNEGIATQDETQNYIKMIKMLGNKYFSNPQRLLQIVQYVKVGVDEVLQQTFKKMTMLMNELQIKINRYSFTNSRLQDQLEQVRSQILHAQKPYATSIQTKSSSLHQKLLDDQQPKLSQQFQKYLTLKTSLKIEPQQFIKNEVKIGWDISDGIQQMTNQMRAKIQKVIVTCCVNPEKQLNKILSLPNLEILQIFWHELSSKSCLLKIINNLHSLKRLVLNCANQFDQQCSKLVTKKLSKIKKLQYGWDFLNCLREYDENIYFCLSPFTNRGCPLRTSVTREMAVGLKKLQNVWLGDLMYFRPSSHQIPFKNLKQFTLGQSNGKYFQIPQKFCSQLSEMKQLLSLALLHVTFDEKRLCQIIENNPFLKNITIQDCNNVSDQTLKALVKYCNINSLSIRENNLIEGIPLAQMINLTTLILVECSRISLVNTITAMKNMRYLTFLNLYGNSWVTNQLTNHIPNQLSFQTLNLGRTAITDQALTSITKMKELKVLCLDCNKLSAVSILHISEYFCNLQKISLWGIGPQCLEKNYLQVFAKRLQHLQHLSIRYCKLMCPNLLLTFTSLKFIDIDKDCLTSDVKSSLEKKGVKMILNIEKEDFPIKL